MRYAIIALALFTVACKSGKVSQQEVTDIITVLAHDSLSGRRTFEPSIEKAARFIEREFNSTGLQPLLGNQGYRQSAWGYRYAQRISNIQVNGKPVPATHYVFQHLRGAVDWAQRNNQKQYIIAADANPYEQASKIMGSKMVDGKLQFHNPEGGIVLMHTKHATAFAVLRNAYTNYKLNPPAATLPAKPWLIVLTDETQLTNYSVQAQAVLDSAQCHNIVGILPGKEKPQEQVLISAHYDHIGVQPAVKGDSIANGADDDASGTAAVIALARRFAKAKNNARTLVFVCFTGEELGLYGSTFFGKRTDPAQIVAMVNIEMIGKPSKFGPGGVFVTGYEKSNLAQLMQAHAPEGFTLHDDPYKEQNLFMRSDNASMAALGVPAHTFSTTQMDKDQYYHTVDDEIETLDMQNVTNIVNGLAQCMQGLVNGTDTPTRVPVEKK